MPVDPAMATWLGIAAGHGGEGVSPCSWLIVLDGPSNEAAAGELLVIGDENVERVILKNLEEKPTISSQPVNSGGPAAPHQYRNRRPARPGRCFGSTRT